MPFKFNTKQVSLDQLPTDTKQFVKDADDFVEQIKPKWKKIKTYNYKLKNGEKESVTTYGQTIDNEYWLARTSKHDGKSYKFKDFSKYLIGTDSNGEIEDLYNHSKYEIEYIHVLDKYEAIPLESYPEYSKISNKDHLSNWVSVKTFYELGAPLTTREFNEFMLIIPEKDSPIPKTEYVIQLVSNKTLDSSNVRGIYVSIERIRELENGEIEWIMCTSSDSGGNVPKWLQNSMISKSVSGDVPGFLNWLVNQK